jgi:hypothetical protein
MSYLIGLSLQQQLTEAFLHPLFHLRAINETMNNDALPLLENFSISDTSFLQSQLLIDTRDK